MAEAGKEVPGHPGRDRMLVAAATVLAGGALVSTIAESLRLAVPVIYDQSAWHVLAATLAAVAPPLLAAGAVFAAVAFGGAPAVRPGRLATAGALVAAAYGLGFVAAVIEVFLIAEGPYTNGFLVSEVLTALSRCALLVAGVVVALAFSRAHDLAERERRLAVAARAALASWGLAALASVFFELGQSRWAPAGFTNGLLVESAGAAVVALGAGRAAAAFRRSGRRARDESAPSTAERDRLLALAAAVACAGFVCLFVGEALVSSAFPTQGGERLEAGALWVFAVGRLGYVGAAACAAVALRRAPAEHLAVAAAAP